MFILILKRESFLFVFVFVVRIFLLEETCWGKSSMVRFIVDRGKNYKDLFN